jgi:quercetin dioxygenase-like cupin family protein
MHIRNHLFSTLAFAALMSVGTARAHAPDGGEKITPLQLQKMLDAPGKQAVMAMVSYKPGQASTAHQHGGTVMAYVLEGSVISQLKGEPPKTYRAGESWVEVPHVPHLQSRNASRSRPAKLLVWLVMDEGGQVKEPVPE